MIMRYVIEKNIPVPEIFTEEHRKMEAGDSFYIENGNISFWSRWVDVAPQELGGEWIVGVCYPPKKWWKVFTQRNHGVRVWRTA
jgi:UDP-N-acetyl-D-mannosaminuronic acid transferase (WecB/TagA/CpsF family)